MGSDADFLKPAWPPATHIGDHRGISWADGHAMIGKTVVSVEATGIMFRIFFSDGMSVMVSGDFLRIEYGGPNKACPAHLRSGEKPRGG